MQLDLIGSIVKSNQNIISIEGTWCFPNVAKGDGFSWKSIAPCALPDASFPKQLQVSFDGSFKTCGIDIGETDITLIFDNPFHGHKKHTTIGRRRPRPALNGKQIHRNRKRLRLSNDTARCFQRNGSLLQQQEHKNDPSPSEDQHSVRFAVKGFGKNAIGTFVIQGIIEQVITEGKEQILSFQAKKTYVGLDDYTDNNPYLSKLLLQFDVPLVSNENTFGTLEQYQGKCVTNSFGSSVAGCLFSTSHAAQRQLARLRAQAWRHSVLRSDQSFSQNPTSGIAPNRAMKRKGTHYAHQQPDKKFISALPKLTSINVSMQDHSTVALKCTFSESFSKVHQSTYNLYVIVVFAPKLYGESKSENFSCTNQEFYKFKICPEAKTNGSNAYAFTFSGMKPAKYDLEAMLVGKKVRGTEKVLEPMVQRCMKATWLAETDLFQQFEEITNDERGGILLGTFTVPVPVESPENLSALLWKVQSNKEGSSNRCAIVTWKHRQHSQSRNPISFKVTFEYFSEEENIWKASPKPPVICVNSTPYDQQPNSRGQKQSLNDGLPMQSYNQGLSSPTAILEDNLLSCLRNEPLITGVISYHRVLLTNVPQCSRVRFIVTAETYCGQKSVTTSSELNSKEMDEEPLCTICGDHISDFGVEKDQRKNPTDVDKLPAGPICCSHLYHSQCLLKWSRIGRNSCPLCNCAFTHIVQHLCNDETNIIVAPSRWSNITSSNDYRRPSNVEIPDISPYDPSPALMNDFAYDGLNNPDLMHLIDPIPFL